MSGAIVLAVSGDIRTLTGGYLYDLRLMHALSDLGLTVQHMAFGDSFPHPAPHHAREAIAALQDLPADRAALVDGLAYGALDTDGLSRVRAPLYALVHHPLALEPGLDPGTADAMARRERANLAIARHIFVTSPHTDEILRQHYGIEQSRVTVVQPGFDRPAVRPVPTPAQPPLILSVGLLARRKGHDILLRALARIADLDWQADIVGRDHEPGMTATLSDMIETLGLEGRVTLSGEVSEQGLRERYGRASIFALATRYEGYGIVFGEAMCHALPIVSTRVGAVPGTVGTEAGILVAPEDPEGFARALRLLLSDEGRRARQADASFQAAQGLATWEDGARSVRDAMVSAGRPTDQ